MIPILRGVETPDFFELEVPADPSGPGAPAQAGYPRPASGGLWAAGERITWVAGLVLALSAFMDWYAGSGVGVKLAVIGSIWVPVVVLILTALAMSTHAGRASIFNAGPHGFTEAFYAYTSQTNNNGSAFAGYGALHFSTMLGAFAMLVGRFVPMIAALAIGGSVAMKKTAPASAGTMRTDGPTFVVLLTGVVILLPALTILPALVLGPVVEALTTRLF